MAVAIGLGGISIGRSLHANVANANAMLFLVFLVVLFHKPCSGGAIKRLSTSSKSSPSPCSICEGLTVLLSSWLGALPEKADSMEHIRSSMKSLGKATKMFRSLSHTWASFKLKRKLLSNSKHDLPDSDCLTLTLTQVDPGPGPDSKTQVQVKIS